MEEYEEFYYGMHGASAAMQYMIMRLFAVAALESPTLQGMIDDPDGFAEELTLIGINSDQAKYAAAYAKGTMVGAASIQAAMRR